MNIEKETLCQQGDTTDELCREGKESLTVERVEVKDSQLEQRPTTRKHHPNNQTEK